MLLLSMSDLKCVVSQSKVYESDNDPNVKLDQPTF